MGFKPACQDGTDCSVVMRTETQKSVFKNYDPDQRDSISQEDFESISMSFPFSFYGLERERYGVSPSRDTDVEVSTPSAGLCGAVQLLFGIPDCSMICHKHCKNQVELECQSRHFLSSSSSSSSDSTPRTATLATSHHPSSGSEEEMFLFPPGWEQGRSPMVSLSTSPGSRLIKHASTQTEQASPAVEEQEERPLDGCNKTQKQLLELVKELEKERDRLVTANQCLQNRYTQLEAENRRLLKAGSPGSPYEIAPRFI
ncbi:hypothetical protein Chor_001922 [Crotalus horridus]